MHPRVQFVHLRIPDSWPDSVDKMLSIVDQNPGILSPHMLYPTLSTLGSLRPEDVAEACLTDRDVVVRVALLSLRLFQSCAADEIADIRNEPARLLRCPQRLALVKDLAMDLLAHEKVMVEVSDRDANWPAKGRDALRWLETMARWYTDLYRRRRLSLHLVTPNQLKRASGAFTLLLESLEDRTYEAWAKSMDRTLHDSLIDCMRQTFQQYAPAAPRYSNVCIDYMVAVILKHFGLETTGTASQIAARFRKRLRQQKK